MVQITVMVVVNPPGHGPHPQRSPDQTGTVPTNSVTIIPEPSKPLSPLISPTLVAWEILHRIRAEDRTCRRQRPRRPSAVEDVPDRRGTTSIGLPSRTQSSQRSRRNRSYRMGMPPCRLQPLVPALPQVSHALVVGRVSSGPHLRRRRSSCVCTIKLGSRLSECRSILLGILNLAHHR
jgi:hypothetical protein